MVKEKKEFTSSDLKKFKLSGYNLGYEDGYKESAIDLGLYFLVTGYVFIIIIILVELL